MLVLTRKIGEKLVIDNRITVTVLRSSQGHVRLGIEAPLGVEIVRSELLRREQPEQELVPPHWPA